MQAPATITGSALHGGEEERAAARAGRPGTVMELVVMASTLTAVPGLLNDPGGKGGDYAKRMSGSTPAARPTRATAPRSSRCTHSGGRVT